MLPKIGETSSRAVSRPSSATSRPSSATSRPRSRPTSAGVICEPSSLAGLPKLTDTGLRAHTDSGLPKLTHSALSSLKSPAIQSRPRDDDISTCDVLSTRSSISDPDPCISTTPDNTHILFDWDDTLLPSTAIRIGVWTERDMVELQKTVRSILTTAASLGNVTIVTNAQDPWILQSSRKYLPALVKTLDDVEFQSARAQFEQEFPRDTVAWKREAFKQILRDHVKSKSGLNVVVIGDSSVEMEAAHLATNEVDGTYLVKTIQMIETPTPNQLLGQLRHLKQKLTSLAQASPAFSYQLTRRKDRDDAIANGWTLEAGPNWAQVARASSEDDFSLSP